MTQMNPLNSRRPRTLLALSTVTLAASLLVACGGGGGDSGSGSSPSARTGTIGGTATKGPVDGATVTAYSISNGARGGRLGSALTDARGNFTMTLDPYSGSIMLQVHGGSYPDEATGARMNMLDADDMSCVVPSVSVTAGSATTGLQVTPLTSMARAWAERMAGGMTATNIDMANMRVGAAYLGPGTDILRMHPVDPTVAGSANGASTDATHYGMLLAAMSQEAHDLGMSTSSSAMVTAMMDDAADGIMDGRMDGTAIAMGGMGGMGGGNMMTTAGSGQLAISMATFVGGPMNRSGVVSIDEMQALMDRLARLATAGGHL